MPLYRHPDLVVLRVRKDAAAFVKAYTTNTIEAPRAAFLTREGKTAAVAYQSKISDDEALLAVGRAFAEKLMAHLSKYLALSETKVEPAEKFFVYFDLEEGTWFFSEKPEIAPASPEDFTRFRVQRAIPEQGVDFTDEMPLCVDARLVSFDKGCYLGQEIVARVHYRGAPPRRLVVKKESECSPEESARMTSKTDLEGEIAGFVFV